jgi:hypothetical protein
MRQQGVGVLLLLLLLHAEHEASIRLHSFKTFSGSVSYGIRISRPTEVLLLVLLLLLFASGLLTSPQ